MVASYCEERSPTHAESHPLEHHNRLLDVGLVSVPQRTGQRCDGNEISGPQGTRAKQLRRCRTSHGVSVIGAIGRGTRLSPVVRQWIEDTFAGPS
ncbi:hypothetical protein GCM10010440_57570 [Kitasatospora cinereorecta]